jgi:aldose 1-epimerase
MIVLRGGDAALRVDAEAGGRVVQLTVDDLDLLVDAGSTVAHWGSYVMAPWAGRVRRGHFTHLGVDHHLPTDLTPPHAIHGTVLTQRWAVVEETASTVVLECPLGGSWPWAGRVRHTVTMADGRADFALEVHADDEPFPASAGWHPWFRRRLGRGGPAEIGLDTESMLRRDADGIPTGARVPVPDGPWDDCFDGVRWPVALQWRGALRLEVGASTQYAVVYDELEHAVCIEPQTGPPDALTLEPVVVTPTRPLIATMNWSWR